MATCLLRAVSFSSRFRVGVLRECVFYRLVPGHVVFFSVFIKLVAGWAKGTVCLRGRLRALAQPRVRGLRLRQLRGAIHRYVGSPFCGRQFTRGRLDPRSVHSLSSLRGVPFAAGRSLHSACPFKLTSMPLRGAIHLRSSDKAAKGPAIVLRARGSLSR